MSKISYPNNLCRHLLYGSQKEYALSFFIWVYIFLTAQNLWTDVSFAIKEDVFKLNITEIIPYRKSDSLTTKKQSLKTVIMIRKIWNLKKI